MSLLQGASSSQILEISIKQSSHCMVRNTA